MGYLDNSILTVDAILTRKGRELLARGDGSFSITQFALADDEIDYTLYDPTHPSGSAYYGEAIESMPILEAFVDENQSMKYKLATLPRGTAKLPVVDLGYSAITLKQGASLSVTPQTLNYLGSSQIFETSGYVATIADVRALSSFVGIGITSEESTRLNNTTTIGTNVSKTVIGSSITLTATTVNTLFGANRTEILTSMTVTGLDSGARITVPVKIVKMRENVI